MNKYYSLDLRRRAARFCLKHGSGRTAETFLIGRATAVRWADKMQKTGAVAIGKIGGHRHPVLEYHEDWVRDRIASETHVSLRRLQAELNERGIIVGMGLCDEPFTGLAIRAAAINPKLLTSVGRLQYNAYLRREKTNKGILAQAAAEGVYLKGISYSRKLRPRLLSFK